MNTLPIKIGVTGSIGTGKTTIVSEFSKLNIPTWNSDEVVHTLYEKGNKGYRIIKKLVPEAATDNLVNRNILSEAILQKPSILKTIEKYIHPLVEINRLNFIKVHDNKDVIVFDIPLLFETSCDIWLDYIIIASVPFSIQKKRVLARKSMNEEKFLYFRSKQHSLKEHKNKANIILNTNVSFNVLSKQIGKILNEILPNND